MNHRWLHLRFAAPLLSFGGVSIDQVGPTRDFPSASAISGLLANALGWHWSDRAKHQGLQDSLVFGAATLRRGRLLIDMQNAKLSKSDVGWTVEGIRESREGGDNTQNFPHRRERHYLADHDCRVVLRLEGAGELGLDDVASALTHPARPLYLGRKSCLPTGEVLVGEVQAENARSALRQLQLEWEDDCMAIWPELEDLPDGARIIDMPDLRNWHSGMHAGSRRIVEGRLL